MASTPEFLEHVLGLLADVPNITYREFRDGDYLLYVDEKKFGGIFADRFLVNVVPGSMSRLGAYDYAYTSYEPMLRVEEEDQNPEFVAELIESMKPDLHSLRGKRK